MVWGFFFLRDVFEEYKKFFLEEEILWLKIRFLILRLISGFLSFNYFVELKNSEKIIENGVFFRIDIFRLLF